MFAPVSLPSAARMKSILYFAVLIVSFGPSVILLTLGVIFSPAWLYSLFESQMATMVPFLMVVAGLLGFWGMLALNNLTLYPYKTDTPPKRLIVFLSLGCIASLTATIFAAYMDWLLAIAMFLPIPVTACLTYRNRAYFYKQVRS
jgi:membrane protease YdiL (CAAX protease family)